MSRNIPGPVGDYFRSKSSEENENKSDVKVVVNNNNNNNKREGFSASERTMTTTTTTTSSRAQHMIFTSEETYRKVMAFKIDNNNNNNNNSLRTTDEGDDFKTIKWLKRGGNWRSGRMNYFKAFVKTFKRTNSHSSKNITTTTTTFDGAFVFIDSNGDTITATCDYETLKTFQAITKRGAGVILKDVAVLHASTTEQHLVFMCDCVVKVFETSLGDIPPLLKLEQLHQQQTGRIEAVAPAIAPKIEEEEQKENISMFAAKAMQLLLKKRKVIVGEED
jgi:hypothetical protein